MQFRRVIKSKQTEKKQDMTNDTIVWKKRGAKIMKGVCLLQGHQESKRKLDVEIGRNFRRRQSSRKVNLI